MSERIIFVCLWFAVWGVAGIAIAFSWWYPSARYLHEIWCDNCKFERFAWQWNGRPAPQSGAKCSTCGCRNTRKRESK